MPTPQVACHRTMTTGNNNGPIRRLDRRLAKRQKSPARTAGVTANVRAETAAIAISHVEENSIVVGRTEAIATSTSMTAVITAASSAAVTHLNRTTMTDSTTVNLGTWAATTRTTVPRCRVFRRGTITMTSPMAQGSHRVAASRHRGSTKA